MQYVSVGLVLYFYIFLLFRSLFLAKRLGQPVCARSGLLITTILVAGIASAIFIGYLLVPGLQSHIPVLVASSVLPTIGLGLITLGSVCATIASLSMGNSWRMGLIKEHSTELVTAEVFRFSRNPYFFSYYLVLLGMLCWVPSLILIAIVLLDILLFHLMILREEKHLEAQHGAHYRAYKQQVRRYL